MTGVTLCFKWITWAICTVPVWSPPSHQGGCLCLAPSPPLGMVSEKGGIHFPSAMPLAVS
jgi:hypothetical protein